VLRRNEETGFGISIAENEHGDVIITDVASVHARQAGAESGAVILRVAGYDVEGRGLEAVHQAVALSPSAHQTEFVMRLGEELPPVITHEDVRAATVLQASFRGQRSGSTMTHGGSRWTRRADCGARCGTSWAGTSTMACWIGWTRWSTRSKEPPRSCRWRDTSEGPGRVCECRSQRVAPAPLPTSIRAPRAGLAPTRHWHRHAPASPVAALTRTAEERSGGQANSSQDSSCPLGTSRGLRMLGAKGCRRQPSQLALFMSMQPRRVHGVADQRLMLLVARVPGSRDRDSLPILLVHHRRPLRRAACQEAWQPPWKTPMPESG
jgi:hypothetical protein